jgi:hypothetical protein
MIAVASLAACGGGGGGSVVGGVEVAGPTVGTYVELADTGSADTDLIYRAFDTAGSLSTGGTSLDHDTGALTAGALAGTIDSGRTQIVLLGGGVATVTNGASTEYLRIFSTSGGSPDLFGIFGQATDIADMPTTNADLSTGAGSFSGVSAVTAANGTTLFVLNGSVTVTADFDAGLIDTRLHALSGTRTDSGGTVNVSNVGSIRINDAILSGNSFTNGTAVVSGAFSLSGAQDISGSGGTFFGPLADEVGGTVIIDDTASGTLQVFGVYAAE